MKKLWVSLLTIVMVIVAVTGCGGGGDATTAANGTAAGGSNATGNVGDIDTLNLKLTCNGTDIANDTSTANIFKELIEERSGGKITVTVYPNDQLASGDMAKGLELVCDGTVDIDIHSTSIISNLDNSLMVSTLPWTFSGYQEAEDYFFGTGGEYINSVLEQKGLVYLGAVHNGFKAMTCSKVQIKTPDDLKGLKIRIPGGDFFSAFYTAYGASRQAMSWAEVFTALQQGTIDGHDNSLSTINSANVQEVQKYITISNHTYEAFTWSANKAKFDSYSPATQELIKSCVEEACKTKNQDIVNGEEDLKTKFAEENGCELYTLTEDDIAAFKAVIADLLEEYKGIYGEKACTAFGIK